MNMVQREAAGVAGAHREQSELRGVCDSVAARFHRFYRAGFVVSRPFAKSAKGWGTARFHDAMGGLLEAAGADFRKKHAQANRISCLNARFSLVRSL